MSLPKEYQWLQKESGPKMLIEALKLYGTKEFFGTNHNQVILDWAKVVGIPELVKTDEQAWCGLFMAVVLQRSGRPFVKEPLCARNWSKWGVPVNQAMLGDVMVFRRTGGGHVGIYVGEDATHFHVLGGNQGNAVSIVRIARSRLLSVQRPPYLNQPANVRVIRLAAVGVVSGNEA